MLPDGIKTVLKEGRTVYVPESDTRLRQLLQDRPDIYLGDIDISELTSLWGVCADLERENWSGLETWNVSHISNFAECFEGCVNFNGRIENWDVSAGRVFKRMFAFCQNFDLNLGSWDVSHARDFTMMFFDCRKFRGRGLKRWDVSAGVRFDSMFETCQSLEADLSSWNPRQLESCEGMLLGATFKGDLSCWRLPRLRDGAILPFTDHENDERIPEVLRGYGAY
jgi:hypothetical protein